MPIMNPTSYYSYPFHHHHYDSDPSSNYHRSTNNKKTRKTTVSTTSSTTPSHPPKTGPSSSSLLEEATQDVMDTFREVLSQDPSALLPILGCLSSMSHQLSPVGRTEAFDVALQSLEIVGEVDLPMLITTLFQQTLSDHDAHRAIDALRTEVYWMEKITTTTNTTATSTMSRHTMASAPTDIH